jgi:hypothetical protein
MRRAISWMVAIVLALAVVRYGGEWALTAWVAHKKNYEAHSMHEGHVIVDEIKVHDPSINVTWTNDDHGQPDVVVRNVFDREKQDAILSWAKAVKREGRVKRHITVDFQKEIPHNDLPDTILRTEEF